MVVGTATNAAFGTIVVDAQGMTLYRNTQDTDAALACTGACTTVWPPLLAPAGFTANGVLGTRTRPDGESQVTYEGAPLYRYAEDRGAGDTKGQGVGGTWFVVLKAGSSGSATSTTAAAPAAIAGTGSATTRPATTTTTTRSRATTPAGAATTSPTTAAASPTTSPATSPPTTSAPVTSAPTTTPAPTSPPPTYTPPTNGSCDYPPCYP